jgi:hypothetical protein
MKVHVALLSTQLTEKISEAEADYVGRRIHLKATL